MGNLRYFSFTFTFFVITFTFVHCQTAPRCPTDNSTCILPNCRCSSAEIPGGFQAENTPQIVFLSFDSAVTTSNFPLYEELLFNRKNPNGASISATFFVAHEYNDYNKTHQLWRRGHDIALNSITRYSSTTYWASLNTSMWTAEIVDQRAQLSMLARIPPHLITGMRAQFLQIGGDLMYRALYDGSLNWECSRPTLNMRQPGLWPYTNDYLSTQDCQISPCPTGEYKSFWTIPMIDLMGLDNNPCPMPDSCQPRPETSNETFTLLQKNFLDQYNGNRAPYGVFTTAGWLIGSTPDFDERKAGYIEFLDYLAGFPDVYIVSISKGIEWIREPVALDDIEDFEPWQAEQIKQNDCTFPTSCRYDFDSSERYMTSCVPCPARYPWLHNPTGQP